MSAAEWYRANAKARGLDVTITADHERCLDTLAAIDRLYNLPTFRPIAGGGIVCTPWHVSALFRGDLSTFDSSSLTRLVLAAHRNCVRVSLSVWTARVGDEIDDARLALIYDEMTYEYRDVIGSGGVALPPLAAIEIQLHARHSRDGRVPERHPTIEAVLAGTSEAVAS